MSILDENILFLSCNGSVVHALLHSDMFSHVFTFQSFSLLRLQQTSFILQKSWIFCSFRNNKLKRGVIYPTGRQEQLH